MRVWFFFLLSLYFVYSNERYVHSFLIYLLLLLYCCYEFCERSFCCCRAYSCIHGSTVSLFFSIRRIVYFYFSFYLYHSLPFSMYFNFARCALLFFPLLLSPSLFLSVAFCCYFFLLSLECVLLCVLFFYFFSIRNKTMYVLLLFACLNIHSN